MSRLASFFVLLTITTLLLVGCSVDSVEQRRIENSVATSLSRLSIQEKVAQLLIVEVPSAATGSETYPLTPLFRGAAGLKPGGIYLSVENPYAAAAVASDLLTSNTIPPFIVKNLVTGRENEISILTNQVAPVSLAVTGDSSLSAQIGRIVGLEAAAIGISLLIEDPDWNPDSSRQAAQNQRDVYQEAFENGLEESAVLLADRIPLALAIKSAADSIPSLPSSRSAQSRLRIRDLNWDDGISSDSLKHLILLSLSGDADMLMTSSNPRRLRDTLMRIALDGKLTVHDLDTRVRKILTAKLALDSVTRTPPSISAIQRIGSTNEHHYFGAKAARKSIVAARVGDFISSYNFADKLTLVVLSPDTTRSVTQFHSAFDVFHDSDVVTRYVSRDNESSIYPEVLRGLSASSKVIIAQLGPYPTVDTSAFAAFTYELADAQIPALFAGMAETDDLLKVPNSVGTVLVSYGSGPTSIKAMTDAIFGMADVCGDIPVDTIGPDSRDVAHCIKQQTPRPGFPGEVGLDATVIGELNILLEEAIADSAFPGAAVAVGRNKIIAELGGFGKFTYDWKRNVGPESIYDLASLTKVIATTTAVMQLYESQQLSLDDPIVKFLPEFGENNKANITIRDLLTHTSGLIPFRPFYQTGASSRSDVINRIMADSLIFEPGSESRYSDFGPIILAVIIEQLSGIPFREYAATNIFTPLGMRNTDFRDASAISDENVVPTEDDDYFRHRLVQGSVHDENAYILGGTAGHAGLFSTVEDLARFADMLLNEGRLGDKTFLKPETIRLFTTRVTDDYTHTRALGWDTKSVAGYSSAGQYFGKRSFGHTGFTGTSIWFDPDQDLYVVLLTNRVYPTRENSKHRLIRPAVANLVFESIRSRSDVTYFDESK